MAIISTNNERNRISASTRRTFTGTYTQGTHTTPFLGGRGGNSKNEEEELREQCFLGHLIANTFVRSLHPPILHTLYSAAVKTGVFYLGTGARNVQVRGYVYLCCQWTIMNGYER